MKKKICLISIIGLALLSGCSKGYKEGVYTGTAIDSYGGQNNTATAIVTVDKNGKITDVNLDTTYTKDGVETTKKTLGDAYGMYGNAKLKLAPDLGRLVVTKTTPPAARAP